MLLEVNLSVLFRSLTDTAFDGNYDTVYIYPEDFEKSVILSWLICPSQVPVKNLRDIYRASRLLNFGKFSLKIFVTMDSARNTKAPPLFNAYASKNIYLYTHIHY